MQSHDKAIEILALPTTTNSNGHLKFKFYPAHNAQANPLALFVVKTQVESKFRLAQNNHGIEEKGSFTEHKQINNSKDMAGESRGMDVRSEINWHQA